MTLPSSYSWFPCGERLRVPYEAAQGRRINAIGAYFTHGPRAGHLETKTWAALPKSRAKKRCPTLEEQAAAHGLRAEEVGPIDAQRFIDFVWQSAGRPPTAPADWRRERPLWIVLDNDSVHTSQTVADTRPAWAAAGIELFYLPAYCPELSAIEPIWHDTKHHHLPTRSFPQVAPAKKAVEDALAAKAQRLRDAAAKTTTIHRRAA